MSVKERLIWQGDDIIGTLSCLVDFVAETEPDPHLIRLLIHLRHQVESQASCEGVFSDLLEWLWDRLHDIHWTKVSNAYRTSFGIVSAVKILLAIHNEDVHASLGQLFKALDLGILLGSPESHAILTNLSSTLKEKSRADSPIAAPDGERRGTWNLSALPRTIPATVESLRTRIEALDSGDVVGFYRDYLLTQRPVLLRQGCVDWPAMEKWRNVGYIREGKC